MAASREVSPSLKGTLRTAWWLMIATALWSGLFALQLLALGHNTYFVDGVPVGSDWTVSWVLLALALVSLASSVAAAALLRRGDAPRARAALVLVALSGWTNVLAVASSVVCLWITRDRR